LKENSSEYKNIFSSTFLFGFVQVFNILIKIVLNKVAAIYLGAGGIGMIGLFQSAIAIIKTFSGMEIHQSAVEIASKFWYVPVNITEASIYFNTDIRLVSVTIN